MPTAYVFKCNQRGAWSILSPQQIVIIASSCLFLHALQSVNISFKVQIKPITVFSVTRTKGTRGQHYSRSRSRQFTYFNTF